MSDAFNPQAEIADSLRRFRAWKAEMRSKGLTEWEASLIASAQQLHEMWQIEQRIVTADPAEAEKHINDAEPEFHAQQQARWADLMHARELDASVVEIIPTEVATGAWRTAPEAEELEAGQ